MSSSDHFDLDATLRDVAEIGVGAVILGLRRVNIERRELAERVPAAVPVIDAALGCVENIAAPVSAAVGSAVATVGDAVPGDHGEWLQRLGVTLADAGPELLRLSGLTKRD